MPTLTSAGAVPRPRRAPDGATAPDSAADHLAQRLVGLGVAFLVPVLVISADVLAGGPLRRLDGDLAYQGWHRVDPLLTSVALAFDRLGQRAVAGTVLVAVAAYLAWRLRSWRPLVVTGAALVVLNVVVGAMKLSIGRTKPLSGQDLLYVGGSQFPSGHAANAVVSWGLLAYLLIAYSRRRVPARTLLVAAGVTTVLVCVSSLYLDYHWLTDLVAGVALGVALLAFVVAWDLTRVGAGSTWSRPDEETARVLRTHGLAPHEPTHSGDVLVDHVPVHAAARHV